MKIKIKFNGLCEARLLYSDGILCCSFTGLPGDVLSIVVPDDCFLEFVPNQLYK